MFKLCVKIPRKISIAFSGGIDSTVVVDFLTRYNAHDVTLMFFHHGTHTSDLALEFVSNYASSKNLPLLIGRLPRNRYSYESLEEFWRIERYKFLNSVSETVITCHHLDDVLETWLFSSFHGCPKLIPITNNNIIRPFLLTKKSEFIKWSTRYNVSWIEDSSNSNLSFARNRIRHNIVPEVLKINPGIYKVLSKKLLNTIST
jgi:tRNA(Ile)-lysidine synthetase-like protein